MLTLLLLMAVGALAGIMAGLLGIGGGLIIVPALAFLLPLQGVAPEHALHVAVATSLASIVLTACASAYAHHRHGGVDWVSLGWLLPGLLLGASTGALLVALMPRLALTLFVAAFCVFAAWQILASGRGSRAEPAGKLDFRLLLPGGLAIGAVSAAVGIGGGSLTVPLLHRLGRPLRVAIGTSAAAGLPIALASALGYALASTPAGLSYYSIGLIDLKVALALGSMSILTAPLGAALAQRWPVALLKRVFAGWLLVVACLLLWQ